MSELQAVPHCEAVSHGQTLFHCQVVSHCQVMFHCQAVSHYQALSHYQAVSHCQAMFHCQAMSHCPATQLVIHNRILLNDASSHLAARLGPAAHWPIPKQENGAYITRTSFLFEILGSN